MTSKKTHDSCVKREELNKLLYRSHWENDFCVQREDVSKAIDYCMLGTASGLFAVFNLFLMTQVTVTGYWATAVGAVAAFVTILSGLASIVCFMQASKKVCEGR